MPKNYLKSLYRFFLCEISARKNRGIKRNEREREGDVNSHKKLFFLNKERILVACLLACLPLSQLYSISDLHILSLLQVLHFLCYVHDYLEREFSAFAVLCEEDQHSLKNDQKLIRSKINLSVCNLR